MLRRDFLRQVALAGLGAAAAPGPSTAAPAGAPATAEAPAVAPKYALGFDTWWADPALAAAVHARGQTRP